MDSKLIKEEPGIGKNELDETQQNANSPLGTLDPSRLTDMVVDHHMPQFQQQSVQQHWQSAEPGHGQGMRPQNLQDGTLTPQPRNATPQMMQQGMCMPGQSPMGSPITGNTNIQIPGGIPCKWEDQQGQQGYNHSIQAQYNQGQNSVLPPQSPGGMQIQQQMQSPGGPQSALYQQRMMQMQQGGPIASQGGYSGYPQNSPQWAGQQPGGYVQGPRVMAPQRVPIQRVPYPNPSGYPSGAPGMVQQPGYSGAQCVQRPQQLSQRPTQYPPSVGAGAPPGYGYPGQPPQGYAQQPIGYQRGPQVAQPMRPYMNSPQALMNPNVYPSGQQPQTPQTPQPQYTPNGSRFPQPTPSPHHFGGPDMRSPPLMSPNQTPMARNLSNGDLSAPQQMRMPPSQYYAHDPNMAGNIAPEMCLVGCILHVPEIEKYATDKTDMQNIATTVKLLGGDIDFGPKPFQERLGMITHIITDCYRTTVAQIALKAGKRVVTMQWLLDTVQKKRMEVPWRLAHLPSPFGEGMRPHIGKLISLSGFDADERVAIKFMIETLGARVTPYLSNYNNLLIAKNDGCEKVEKAREWRIPVVNYQWLADAYVGRNNPTDLPQYVLGSQCMDVNGGSHQVEMSSEPAKSLLGAWKYAIPIHPESWNRALEVKRMLEIDENVFPNNKLRESSSAPKEEWIAKMATLRAEAEKKKKKKTVQFRICLTGVDDDVAQMMGAKIRFLGGVVIDDPSKCTHCVVLNCRRSIQLLMAIAVGAYIVKPEFVLNSFDIGQWHDSLDFMMKDDDAERHLGFNLKVSVLRARHKKVFEDVTFYLTPSIDPSRDILARLIEVAGGKVDRERPDPKMLAHYIEVDQPYIVIGTEADLRLVHYLVECNFPIYNSELVLMSVLRQEVDANKDFRVSIDSICPPRATSQVALPPQHPGQQGPPPQGFMQRPPGIQSQMPMRPQGPPITVMPNRA